MHTQLKFNSSTRGGKGGFSLVEITIATGIAAFGLITLLGLLPSGMTTFRDAMNVTVSSQIAQRLIKEAVQTDYDTLVNVASGTTPAPDVPVIKDRRYFNDEGVELQAADAAKAVFHAHIRVMPGTGLPAVGGTVDNTSLATVTVQVALNPSNRNLAVIGGSGSPLSGTLDPAGKVPFVTYTSHIAKVK